MKNIKHLIFCDLYKNSVAMIDAALEVGLKITAYKCRDTNICEDEQYDHYVNINAPIELIKINGDAEEVYKQVLLYNSPMLLINILPTIDAYTKERLSGIKNGIFKETKIYIIDTLLELTLFLQNYEESTLFIDCFTDENSVKHKLIMERFNQFLLT